MEGIGSLKRKRGGPEEALNLPAGFRFNPTDEELVVHYLCKKAASQPFDVPIVAELDLYKFDPWDLPEKALFGEKEWYFFSPRDRKYPNGSRPNRAAGSGYWKATGTDKPIPSASRKVGVKKALVFYKGKPPKGSKTNWIMHEYRLAESTGKPSNTQKTNNGSNNKKGSLRMDDWVLCRIYYKKVGGESQRDAFETGEGFKIVEEEAQVCVNSNASNTMPNTSVSLKPYVAACSTSLEEYSRDDDDSTIDELDQDCERHMPMDTNIPEQQHLPPPTSSSQNEPPLHHHNSSTANTANDLNTANGLSINSNMDNGINNFATISPPHDDSAAPRLLDDTLGCQQVYSTNTLDRLESLISLIDGGLFANIGSGFLNRP